MLVGQAQLQFSTAGIADQPTDGKGDPAIVRNLHRNLVGGATNPAGPHFQNRRGIFHCLFKHPQRLLVFDLLADGVIDIMRVIGAPNGLHALGYSEDDLDALTDKGWKQRRVVDNAARPITRDEMREMFAGALRYW